VSRWTTALIVGVVGLAVFALVLGRWLTTPFDDWVPLDPPRELPFGVAQEDLPASAHFECSAAIGGSGPDATATAQADEALAIQSLSRPPCDGIRTEHRVIGLMDFALIALGYVIALVIWRWRKSQANAAPSVATS
jgi:hypothetical protein